MINSLVNIITQVIYFYLYPNILHSKEKYEFLSKVKKFSFIVLRILLTRSETENCCLMKHIQN